MGERSDYAGCKPEPWPDGWGQMHDRDVFLSEVTKELGPDHELSGYRLAPIIRCWGCDSVVFSVEGRDLRFPRWAVVHLTWSGHAEPAPWPRTASFDSMQQIRDHLASDHQD